jgi:hypothetical protein
MSARAVNFLLVCLLTAGALIRFLTAARRKRTHIYLLSIFLNPPIIKKILVEEYMKSIFQGIFAITTAGALFMLVSCAPNSAMTRSDGMAGHDMGGDSSRSSAAEDERYASNDDFDVQSSDIDAEDSTSVKNPLRSHGYQVQRRKRSKHRLPLMKISIPRANRRAEARSTTRREYPRGTDANSTDAKPPLVRNRYE